MTALEEIKKAFPNMFRPLKWHHFEGATEHGCGEWYAHATRGMYHIYDVREKFSNDRPFYAKELSDQFDTLEQAQDAVQNRHELDILMCLDPDFRSTLESLQRENEMLRASRDGYSKQRDEILRLYNEERLAWRPMDSAPKDGKHCILSIPSGGFAYTVQGAFMGGKWINALNVDAEPLAWMPNVMLPDAYCPWKRPFSVPLASTGGEHHAE